MTVSSIRLRVGVLLSLLLELGSGVVAGGFPCNRDRPEALSQVICRRAESVCVAPAQPYRLRLQAACLAGTLRAPLAIVDGSDNDERLVRHFRQWQTRTAFV